MYHEIIHQRRVEKYCLLSLSLEKGIKELKAGVRVGTKTLDH